MKKVFSTLVSENVLKSQIFSNCKTFGFLEYIMLIPVLKLGFLFCYSNSKLFALYNFKVHYQFFELKKKFNIQITLCKILKIKFENSNR